MATYVQCVATANQLFGDPFHSVQSAGPTKPPTVAQRTILKKSCGDPLYVFSDRRAAVEQILDRTTSGNATINDTLLHYVCKTTCPSAASGRVGSALTTARKASDR
jgi:hypothetical protein